MMVPFWRMDQLQKPGEGDFDGELRVKLPAGFKPSEVELQDLHAPAARNIKFSSSEGAVTAPVRITSRAAWLVIKVVGQ